MVTSWPTRRRTSRRCSSARSGGAAATGRPRCSATSPERFTGAWLGALAEALAAEGSVGLIAADPRVPEIRAELERRRVDFRMVERFDLATPLSLVPVSTVKGLEFDQVVLVEPADLADGDAQGL